MSTSDPIYQCASCEQYCDARGEWLEIKNFARVKEIMAMVTPPLLCRRCDAGFTKPAASDRQLPPSDREEE